MAGSVVRQSVIVPAATPGVPSVPPALTAVPSFNAGPTAATPKAPGTPAVSYVPAVAAPGSATPSYVPVVSAEQPAEPPPSLTAGLPDPESVERQKKEFAHNLDQQLKQGIALLEQQKREKTNYVHATADQRKKKYANQVDSQTSQTLLGIEQQHSQQLMLLQTAAAQQKALLDQQAMALKMEYEQKKAKEDMMQRHYQLQKHHFEAQQRLGTELDQLHKSQPSLATAFVQPAPPAVAGITRVESRPSFQPPVAGPATTVKVLTPAAPPRPSVPISTSYAAVPPATSQNLGSVVFQPSV